MNAARVVLAALAFCAHARFAAATDSLTCDIGDDAVELGLLASVGTSPFSLIDTVQGTLTLKPATDWPSAKIDLGHEHLVQKWVDPPELRLWLFVSGDKAMPEINLVIVTQRAAKGDYGGRYRATVRADGNTRERTGRVTCTLE